MHSLKYKLQFSGYLTGGITEPAEGIGDEWMDAYGFGGGGDSIKGLRKGRKHCMPCVIIYA